MVDTQAPKPKFLDIARAAVALGLEVVPLRPGDKLPIEGDWQDSASADDERLRAWAEKYPDANCGAVCKRDKRLILDFDDFKWLEKNWPLAELPETLIVRTGKGGYQMHFKQTPLSQQRLRNFAFPNPAAKDDPKASKNALEVLFDNRQGLVPGCLHPNGRLYKALNSAPLTPVPDSVVEWVSRLMDGRAPARPGQCRPLRDGLDVERVLSGAGLKFDKSEKGDLVYFNYHDKMGLCLVKGAAHSDDKSAFVLNTKNGELWHQCFSQGCERAQKTKKALAAIGLALEDLLVEKWRRHFDSRQDLEDAGLSGWVIEGLCREGESTGWCALPKSGKTWKLLSMSKAFLTGARSWMGRPIPEESRKKFRRVVYFIPEVGRAAFMRRLKLMRLDQFLGKTLFVRTSKLGVPDLLDDEVLEACAGADVYFDSLIRFLDGDENKSETIKNFSKKLFPIADLARSVHVAHHTQKEFENAEKMDMSMFRGSGDISAFLSNGYGLMKLDEATLRVYAKMVFTRDIEEEPEPWLYEGKPHIGESGDLKFVGEADSLREERGKTEATGLLDKLSPEQVSELRKMKDEKLTGEAASARLKQLGLDKNLKSKNSVKKAWKQLEAAGAEPEAAPMEKLGKDF
jgi:hypothetical protein